MATPTQKSPGMESACNILLGGDDTTNLRFDCITNDVCVPAPHGCGQPATEFRDEISQREFTINGMCQACQDSVYGV